MPIRILFSIFCLLFVTRESAFAQYNSHESGYDNGYNSNILGDQEQQIDPPPVNSNTVGGTIRNIIRGVQPQRRDRWGQFEKVPKEQANQYYNNSSEVVIKRQLQQPVQTRKPFDNSLDEMNRSLKAQKKKPDEPTVDNDETDFMGK